MADPTGSGSNGGTTTVVANPPNPPTINTVPNTTTDTTTVQFQNAATKSEVPPQSDPTQFPAYDDEGNLLPGYDLDENNNPVFVGQRPPTTFSTPLADPYAGLTPTQLQDIGGADPTDPYIRARLGIPQLPGSTLLATSGFGTIKTGVPTIDSALGIIGGGATSLFSNFSNTIGGLFGAKPTASAVAATTGSGVAALVAPVTGPPTSKAAVDAANGGEGFGLGTPDGNGGFVNAQGDPVDSVGMPIAGVPPTTYSGTTLSADQADAFYNGTGTLTADQRLAQDQQTAADATVLYPGSNNTNLKNIDAAGGAIARNQVGIANAEQIIAEQNQELADPNISDQRREQLLANNATQENYIRLANDNTAENELVIEANADGYAAGGGNPDSGQPDQVAALVDPGLQPDFVTDAEQIATRDRIAVDQAQDFNTNEDPFEVSRLEAEQDLENQQPVDFAPQEVDAEQDPFEAARLEQEQELNRQRLTEEAADVEPDSFAGQTDEFGGVDEAVAQRQQDVDTANDAGLSAEETDAEFERLRTTDNPEPVAEFRGEGFDVISDPEGSGGFVDSAGNPVDEFGMPISPVASAGPVGDTTGYINDSEAIAQARLDAGGETDASLGAAGETLLASRTANAKNLAQKQATIQAQFKQPGNKDWRVRLSLGPGAQYLYNATPAGVLKPLAANGGTDGVIFPYTPNITTTYSANYEQYDLTHSNYRGIFYKNSRVGDIQLRGTFTAQDTDEANYLLAVIHFFRSVTKMFYGQDDQRGTPPPICLLNGYGGYQFSDHPVVVSAFNYSLPNDVDYIRTTNPNNFGLNLNNRYNPSGVSLPAGGALAGLNRLLNAIPGGLSKGALPRTPAPNTVAGSVTNNVPASYVPTKMEIDITLIPVQTRSQVSQQFSLKGFANGDLLKGGFW
jgi:hypothetical protein